MSSYRTYTHDLDQIHRLAAHHHLILIAVPVLEEDGIEPEYLARLLAGEEEPSRRRFSVVRRRIQPVIRPRLDADLPILWTQHPLPCLHLDAQPPLQHLYVLLLVWMEVQRGLLGAKADELRVLEKEGHFEGEGPVGMWDQAGGYCAVKAVEAGCGLGGDRRRLGDCWERTR